MTWLTPLAAKTVGMVALVAAVLVIIAYLLKMRRHRFEVPFSSLWKRVLEQRDANALWKQLRRMLSLLLTLAIVGLVIAAIQAPTLGVTDRRARNVVILLDTSASMRATDGDPDRPKVTRFERAQERAAALVDSMGGGDQAMVMRVDAQATPLSRFASDKPMLRKVIDDARPADTGADLPRALSAAARPVAIAAVRRWWRDVTGLDHPPDAAAIGRILDVAAGKIARADVVAGWYVRRQQQRLTLFRYDHA